MKSQTLMGMSRGERAGFRNSKEPKGKWDTVAGKPCRGRGAVGTWPVQEGQFQHGQGLECQAEKSGRFVVVPRCLVVAVE